MAEYRVTDAELTATAAAGAYHYMRFCGLGSGANIDLRINENFN